MGGQGYRNWRAVVAVTSRKKCFYSSFHREAVTPPPPPPGHGVIKANQTWLATFYARCVRHQIHSFHPNVTPLCEGCDGKCDGFFVCKPFHINKCDGVTAFYPWTPGRPPGSPRPSLVTGSAWELPGDDRLSWHNGLERLCGAWR